MLLLGFSADGASAFLRTMKKLSGLDKNMHSENLRSNFEKFYFAPLDLATPSMINDPTHLVVKLYLRLLRGVLLIGRYRACAAHIHEVLQKVGKKETGIDPLMATEIKDAMNYDRAVKVCRDEIIGLFNAEEHKATRIYMKMISYVIKGFISIDTEPGDRIRMAWFLVFFCRFWKKSIALRNSESGISLSKDFITPNAYNCIELNAHNMIKFMIMCRDVGKPELFLLHLASSQPCEALFRTFRSMGTTSFTKINFNIHELLNKARRVMKIQSIPFTVKNYDFCIKPKKESLFIPSSLPSNEVISCIVGAALSEAREDLALLGNMLTVIFPDYLLIIKGFNSHFRSKISLCR